ncbi:MAG: T9SS type A sorting domain-containing protein, partial [Candidatus Saccharibacteria bacterium]
SSNSFSLTVPKLSTTAVLLKTNITGTSIYKNQSPDLKIYPNPAKDLLMISLNSHNSEPTEIAVYDMMGRTIQSKIMNLDGNLPLSIDVSSYTQGVYILSVKNNHCSVTKRFSVAN